MTNVKFRDSQTRILNYQGGLMGISAVPGSGKTFTLSHLAAKLVMESDLAYDQEILIVTFSNVAADNFTSRIGAILSEQGIVEGIGYKVRTLHGLASDIIRERPDLAGLGNDFSIIDASESTEILQDLIRNQMMQKPEIFDELVSDNFRNRNNDAKIEKELLTELHRIVTVYIKTAKDRLLSVEELQTHINKTESPTSLLLICQEIFRSYQAALNYRGAVDFDDLIRLAWLSLNNDADLLKSLQYRWPYILEDEAQDSSLVQEAILGLLTKTHQNWVRVGDPNQAINESFTTANPQLLRNFIARPDVRSETLPESGRSCPAIIALANNLNEWTQHHYPNPYLRNALSHPLIELTKPDDPQQNPKCSIPSVYFNTQRFNTQEEMDFIIEDVKAWLEEHPEDTVAVLALSNDRVGRLAGALSKAEIPVEQALMKNPINTRKSAGSIFFILRALVNPTDTNALAQAFKVFYRHCQDDEESWLLVEKCMRYIQNTDHLEDLIYEENFDQPIVFEDMLEEELAHDFLTRFIFKLRRWHQATILPLDQTIITIAQDLMLDPIELATVHKISQLVRQILQDQPEWSINNVLSEIKDIANNTKTFLSFNEAEDGFNPDLHKGKVVVATYHKAKGLEWDKVYLSSLNNFDFPSASPDDYFLSERDIFVEPKNRQAEIKMELEAIINPNAPAYEPGLATIIDRNDVSRERIRLLYVGITRAKKSITASYNTGRFLKQDEALASRELRKFLTDENTITP